MVVFIFSVRTVGTYSKTTELKRFAMELKNVLGTFQAQLVKKHKQTNKRTVKNKTKKKKTKTETQQNN